MPNSGRNKVLSQLRRLQKRKYGDFQLPLEPSFGELGPFDQALDLLMRPGHVVTGAVHSLTRGENPLEGAWQGLTREKQVGYGDILREQGVPEGAGRSIAGFAGDVLLDPVTWLGKGPIEKVGSLAVGGVERPLVKAGVEALEAARGLKTAQSARILTKGAELKPTAILGGLPEGMRLATGGAKTAMEAGRHSLVGGVAPRLSAEKLDRLIVSAGRAAPEVKTLARDLSSEALRGPKGEELLGRGFGAKAVGNVLEGRKSAAVGLDVTRKALEAPSAIKFGPIPLIKTETLKAPIKAAWEGAKKIPVVGAAVRAVGKAGEATGKFAENLFSSKAGLHPEEATAVESARDLMHLRMRREVEFSEGQVADLKKAGFKEGPALDKALEEIAKTMEGVMVKVKEMAEPEAKAHTEREIARLSSTLNGLLGEKKPLVGIVRKLENAIEEARLAQGRRIDKLKSVAEASVQKTQTAIEAKTAASAGVRADQERLVPFNRIAAESDAELQWLKGKHPKTEADLKRMTALKATRSDARSEAFTLQRTVDRKLKLRGENRLLKQKLAAESQSIEARKAALDELRAKTESPGFRPETRKRRQLLPEEIEAKRRAWHAARVQPKLAEVEHAIESKRDALSMAQGKLAAQKPIEVLTEKRVGYAGAPDPLKSIASKISERLAKMHGEEQRLLTLPPETREFYLPHYLKPEIEQALRATVYGTSPEKILRSGVSGASVKAALRRTNAKGVLELTLADMIHGGMIDPDKLAKILAEKGIPFSAADRLVFETDPIVAALRRQLSSARAVSAAEMRDEIMNSPTFLKSKLNLLDEGKIQEAEGILATHPDHQVYVTTRDYIQHFMSDAEREALRVGNRPELVRSLAHAVSADDLEKLAKRASPDVAKVEGYVLPQEIVEHLNKAHEIQFMPEAVGDFLKMYDSIQHLFTTGATVVRPGFHLRNFIGNLWNSMLAGMRNPASMFVAAAMQRGKFAGLKPIAGLEPEEVWKLFQEFGGQRTGWAGAAEDIIKRATSPSKNILSPQGPWARAGSAVGGAIEDNAKLALFIDGLEKGMDPKSAMWRSKKFLFDYSDLSWTEKNVFKRFAPFYSWTRKNVPLQFEQLITNPGKVGILGHAREAADKDFEDLDRPAVADWMQKSLGIPFKKNEDGSISYAIMGGLIPTADLARIDSKQFISMLSPLLKVPLEQMFNEDWFRGRPISRFPGPIPGAGEMVEFMGIPMPARLAHIARNAIILSQVDRALFSEDAGLGGWSNIILGVKPYKQFPERQLKTYFYQKERERHGLEQEAEKQKGLGNEFIAAQLAGRAETLQGRAETAKVKAVEMNPLAFTPKRDTRPQLAPTSVQQFKARIKRQVAKLYGRKVGT